jgi:exosortase
MDMATPNRTQQLAGVVLGVTLVWAYWPVLGDMAARWTLDPKYSHGYLVPLFSLWLLWRGLRKAAADSSPTPWVGSWWGLPVLLLGVGVQAAGGYFYFDWLAEVSLLPSLAGLCLCLGGGRLLRIAWPAIAFLAFMLPLPYRVEVALGQPLQRLAAESSTFLLQMLGFFASAEGNVVVLKDGALDVVDACSGLGMLVTFFALATAVAIVLKRPLLDKIVILASAVPVAVIANTLRIVATGILHETAGAGAAKVLYHDLAGWLMMPLALLLLWLVQKLLSRLLVEVPPPVEGDGAGLGLGLDTVPPAGAGRRRSVPAAR